MSATDIIVKLKFFNRDADPHVEEMCVERSAVSRIMDWYGAFYAGDDYDVYINNRIQELGINGELEPMTIDGDQSHELLDFKGGAND